MILYYRQDSMEKIIKVETPTQSQTEINLTNDYDFPLPKQPGRLHWPYHTS